MDNKKRFASLAEACMTSEKALTEYKSKISVIVRDENSQMINDTKLKESEK